MEEEKVDGRRGHCNNPNGRPRKVDQDPLNIEEAYSRLISAIVTVSVKDIIRGMKYERTYLMKKQPMRIESSWYKNWKDAERFFRSQWFGAMTGLDCPDLLDRMKCDPNFLRRIERRVFAGSTWDAED